MAKGDQADEMRSLRGVGMLQRLKNMRKPGAMRGLPASWQEVPGPTIGPFGPRCRVYWQKGSRELAVMHSLDLIDGEWWDYVSIIGPSGSLFWEEAQLVRQLFLGPGRELRMILRGPPYYGLHIWARKSTRKDG